MEGNKISTPWVSPKRVKSNRCRKKTKERRKKFNNKNTGQLHIHGSRLDQNSGQLCFQGRRQDQKVGENNSKLPSTTTGGACKQWLLRKQAWVLQWQACSCACACKLWLWLEPYVLTWDWVLGLGNSWGLEGWGVRRPYFFIFLMFGLKQGCIPRTSLWKCPKSLCGGVGWCLNIIFGQGFSFGLVFVSGQAFQLAQAALHAPPEVALQCVAGH